MADVARLREADRAQLFLVGALALAVIFVALAVLLNTAIYTGNIATRDAGPGTGDVVEYEQAAVAMADRSLGNVNTYNNSSYADLETTFNDTVSIWSDRANTHSTTGLADASVAVVGRNRGTKIGQKGTRNFTDDNDNADWTVANNSTARAFQMTVKQGSLSGDGLLSGDPEFAVEFTDPGTELTVYVYDDTALTDNVTIALYDSGSKVSECSASDGTDDRVSIDFSAEELGGGSCGALETLTDRLPAQYNVSFENSTQAKGNYSLIVNRSVSQIETGADDASGEPYAAEALYSTDLRVTYRSASTYYRTTVRVAPEELDA